MRKLKIVMVTEWFLPDTGGTESHILELAEMCRKNGHRVTIVLSPGQYKRFRKSGRRLTGIDVRGFPALAPGFFKCRENYRSKIAPLWGYVYETALTGLGLIKELKPDILHCHSMNYCFVTSLLGRILNIPVILTMHVNHLTLSWHFCSIWCVRSFKSRCRKCRKPLPYKGALNIDERFLSNRMKYLNLTDVASIIAPSRYVKDVLNGSGYRQIPVRVSPMWVRMNKFRPRRPSPGLRKRLGVRPGDRIILYIGRIFVTKGIEYLLKALPNVFDHRKDCKLMIVGRIEDVLKDNYARKMQDLIEGPGLAGRVIRVESLDYSEIQRIYSLVEMMVLPSLTETQGLVLLEAMASGVPVISTALPAVREYLVDHKNGILVPPRDSEALTRAIDGLLDNGKLRQRLIDGGLETVQRKYSYERLSGRVLDIYSRSVENRPAICGPEL